MFSSTVLFSWPLVVWALFSRYRVELALPVAIVAGYLLLPVDTGIDLPLLPALNKGTVPVLAAGLFVLIASKLNLAYPHNKGRFLGHPLANAALFVLLISSLFTVMTNPDPLIFGSRYLPGLRPYDGFAITLQTMMRLLPLYLAFKFLGHPEQQKTLIWVLIISALLYSIPTLYEVRMSPQLNRMIYGFYPGSFAQALRGDGFRPLVFVGHGLFLSLFLSLAFLAALGASHIMDKKYRGKLLIAAGFLFTVLVMSKSLGALIVATLIAPVVYFCSVRLQLVVAAGIAACVLTYPMLRSADLVPTERLISYANQIDPQRAASLRTRFHHENTMLTKARQRPLLGWGGFGRWRVYNQAGADVTISDGYWIITFASGGWLRYLTEMGLLTGPLFFLALRARKYKIEATTALLALISAANLVDLIPNSGATVITWLTTGALWGRLAHGLIVDKTSNASSTPETTRVLSTASQAQRNSPYARPYETKVRR